MPLQEHEPNLEVPVVVDEDLKEAEEVRMLMPACEILEIFTEGGDSSESIDLQPSRHQVR